MGYLINSLAYAIHMKGTLRDWDLDVDWVELTHESYKPSIVLRSEKLTGSLCLVSTKLGGKPMGMQVEVFNGVKISILLGCFVRKEMKPRFLVTKDWTNRYMGYTASGVPEAINLGYNNYRLSDKDFEPTLEGLKTRLWRI